MPQLLDVKEVQVPEYAPETGSAEDKILKHLEDRVPILKDSKKKILNDINFEDIMKEADREYMPQTLKQKNAEGKYMFVQDEVKGMRGSRVVPISGQEGEEWRSSISEPTLLVKIQTAISILVDQNPEAVFKALLKKYKAKSCIAKAIWKRSWGVAKSKDQLKLFIFDLAKYGWAVGRTYPRLVQRQGEILTELDIDHPENNKYKKVTITEFNDIYREKLDPYRTWIDDKTNLTDPWSTDDWYFEVDISKDDFDRDFGMYANADKVKFGTLKSDKPDTEPTNDETKQRKDMATIGFYESKNKDLYAIYSPFDKVVVYSSPLPNDDKMLSCWYTYWNERDPRTPYGIGLYEIIKNNKVLYDRLENMTMDQLVLSIYTMLFYSGSNALAGDGEIVISPGVMKQKLPGTTIDQVKIDFDPKAFEGITFMSERMDENTGITPTLQGQVEGKTLGEVLHAKDAALKRLNVPLSNIASGFIEQDAYLTLSWANQVYSLPEVMEFADQTELDEFKAETDREESGTQNMADGRIQADFPRVLELSLDEDKDGTLIESPENRFFTVGKDIKKDAIRWKGQIEVNPQSIISPSQELERQRKLELFNMVSPVVQAIAASMQAGQFQVALAMAKPVVQILEIQDEEPQDWLPDTVVKLLNSPEAAGLLEEKMAQEQQNQATEEQPLFIDPNAPPQDPNAPAPAPGGGGGVPAIPTAPGSQGPQAPKVVPAGDITNPLKQSMTEIGKVR